MSAVAIAETLPPSQVIRARVADVEVKDRIRAVDMDWAHALAADMDRNGPLQRIEVRRLPSSMLRLVFGAHRHAAYQILGWDEVDMDLLNTADKIDAKAREIAENVMRRELSPTDRAAFIAQLYEVEKARNGWEDGQSRQAYAASRRWSKDATAKMADASGLSDEVAAKVGLSPRSLFRALELHRGLSATALRMLTGRPVTENAGQMRALAKLDPALQGRVAQAIIAGQAKSVTEALALFKPAAKPTDESKAWSAVLSNFDRMSAREKRDLLKVLAESKRLPTGVTVTFDGEA